MRGGVVVIRVWYGMMVMKVAMMVTMITLVLIVTINMWAMRIMMVTVIIIVMVVTIVSVVRLVMIVMKVISMRIVTMVLDGLMGGCRAWFESSVSQTSMGVGFQYSGTTQPSPQPPASNPPLLNTATHDCTIA